jgi:2-amino-4-hydroxy-6-hydroxymethyldihydropteridine diphosphokinase
MDNGIFLLMGTNQGEKMKNLEEARVAIGKLPAQIARVSEIYQTAAWGKTDQEDFYNQVIEIATPLDPFTLLKQIKKIEATLGRVITEKWGPRIIDIDILFYNGIAISHPDLAIPHPGIPNRRFTLVPLNEVAPDFVHPISKKKIGTLLAECTDPLDVQIVKL